MTALASNVTLGWPNFSDAGELYAPTLAGGSWLAANPLTNLQDDRLGRVARSTTAALTDTRLRVDLKADRQVGILAAVPTNLSSGAYARYLGVPSSLLFDYEAGDDLTALGYTFTRATSATYFTRAGLLATAGSGVPRDSHFVNSVRCLLLESGRTNVALWNRDLTNVVWTKTNVTAAKTQTGIDGSTNSASLLTATAGNGTCLQAITLGSSARFQSAYVKRITGSGVINMTLDNGATWTAITVTAAWTRVTVPTQTLANPTVGFRIVTNGDAIAVDYVQNEDGTFESTPILTTTVTVTRNADVLTQAYGAVPQAMTVYIKFVELQISGTNRVYVRIGSGTNDGTIKLDRVIAAGTAYAVTRNGATASTCSTGTITQNQVVEVRGAISGTGTTAIGVSLNSGAETTSSEASTRTPDAAFNAQTISIGEDGFLAIQSLRVAPGVQTMAYMRSIIYDSGWFAPWPSTLTAEDLEGINVPILAQVASTQTAFRYASLQIDDIGNADGHVDLGRLVCAAALQAEINHTYGSKDGLDHDSTVVYADSGSGIVDDRPRRRTFDGTFPNTEISTLYAGLHEMQRRCGVKRQFFFVQDPTDSAAMLVRRSYLARFKALSPMEYAACTWGHQPVSIVEAL